MIVALRFRTRPFELLTISHLFLVKDAQTPQNPKPMADLSSFDLLIMFFDGDDYTMKIFATCDFDPMSSSFFTLIQPRSMTNPLIVFSKKHDAVDGCSFSIMLFCLEIRRARLFLFKL